MSDRDAFREARTAGLRARHETREARAIRKQVAEEIASEFERLENSWSILTFGAAAKIARDIGTEETP